jgi:hypothetical protein
MLRGISAEAFDAVATAWRDPLVRALAGEAVTTGVGEVRAVGVAGGVVRVAQGPDLSGRGRPLRGAEP